MRHNTWDKKDELYAAKCGSIPGEDTSIDFRVTEGYIVLILTGGKTVVLDTMFTLKYFFMGTVFGGSVLLLWSGLATSSNDQAFALFLIVAGIAALAIGLWDLYKRIKLMHDVRLSPDYEAMEADFAASESFLDGYIFVGKNICSVFTMEA